MINFPTPVVRVLSGAVSTQPWRDWGLLFFVHRFSLALRTSLRLKVLLLVHHGHIGCACPVCIGTVFVCCYCHLVVFSTDFLVFLLYHFLRAAVIFPPICVPLCLCALTTIGFAIVLLNGSAQQEKALGKRQLEDILSFSSIVLT